MLASLCDDQTDDWRQMAQNGANFALVGMLSSRSPSLQGAALTLLALLCANPNPNPTLTPTLTLTLTKAPRSPCSRCSARTKSAATRWLPYPYP